MEISPEKKQESQRNLVSTIKFCAVFCPLLLVCTAPIWFKARTQIPIYHRDCRSALTVTAPVLSSLPCYDETATARLQSYYGRGGVRDEQEVLLTFPDGRTTSMQADGDSNKWWNESEVDGSCLAEIWHGEIRSVFRPGVKILSKQNPELDGDTESFMVYIVMPGTLTLGFWFGLFVLWQRGDLFKKENKQTYGNSF